MARRRPPEPPVPIPDPPEMDPDRDGELFTKGDPDDYGPEGFSLNNFITDGDLISRASDHGKDEDSEITVRVDFRYTEYEGTRRTRDFVDSVTIQTTPGNLLSDIYDIMRDGGKSDGGENIMGYDGNGSYAVAGITIV